MIEEEKLNENTYDSNDYLFSKSIVEKAEGFLLSLTLRLFMIMGFAMVVKIFYVFMTSKLTF